MSTLRKMAGGRVKRSELPVGPTGRTLCRWCAIEVPPPRRTFCSEWCVHEWRLRTDAGYLRDRVFLRDKGVCAICRVNTVEAHLQLRRARGERRQERLVKWGLRGVNRKSLWDADHILPVAEGGGECDLENIRTLCLICHRQATQELIERLRLAKGALKRE